ncbi:MAG: hypothetical protein MK102_02075 [Fuerstiella sp.]|nr:hypothetical protein [Fuerstiella sp.]
MIRNAGTNDEPLKCYRVALVVTAVAAVHATVHTIAQEVPQNSQLQDAEREEYASQQRKRVRDARDINVNLCNTITKLKFAEEDNFRKILRNGTQNDTETLKNGLRWEIYRASDPVYKSNPAGFQGLKARLQNNILSNAGVGIGGRRQRLEFRKLVCSEALICLKELLENNFQARSLAVELLPSLETVTDARQRQIFDDAADVLIEVLANEQQPDAIKLRAAESIALYLQNCDPGALIEIKFAAAVRDELDSWLPATGYQIHLIDALSRVRAAREIVGTTRRPVVIETLVAVMQDKRREALIRCRAAGALGLAGIDDSIKGAPLAWKVVQLSAEMAAAYNQDSSYKHWSTCGLELFFAFKDRDASSQRGQSLNGMLNKFDQSALVQSAYAQALPVIAAVLDRQGEVDAATIESVNKWVSDNQPNDLSFDAKTSAAVNP